METERLTKVKEAFWKATPPEHMDVAALHDILIDAGMATPPTLTQSKTLFMTLPAHTIGSILSWGANDTEVRGEIARHLQQNKVEIFGSLDVLLD